MGVLSCSRDGCDNIMCRTYVYGIGYVCDECQDQFKQYLKSKHTSIHSNHDIEEELKNFLEIDKDNFEPRHDFDNQIDTFFLSYRRD